VHPSHAGLELFNEPRLLFLATTTVGQISDRQHHREPVSDRDRTDADIRRELRSIAPPSDEIGTLTHGPKSGSRHEIAAMPHMGASKTLRNQDLDCLTAKGCPVVAEQLLRLLIDELDAATVVDNEHGIGRGVEKLTTHMC
jgi:hypothetical protein